MLLVEQELALGVYLETLLCPRPAQLPVPVRPAVVVVPAAPAHERVATMEAPPLAEVVEVVEVPVTAPKVAAQPTPAPAAAPAVVAAHEDIPAWAQEPFQCLLLSVNGLTLALPLVALNRILPWSEPGALPGYAPWMLGIVRHMDHNVRVVDTARVVMPETCDSGHAEGSGDNRHIVLIGEGLWGLVCEEVSSVITLDPSQVRWRTARTKRPWLAGTVVDRLCALLDVERLTQSLTAELPPELGR